MRFLANFEKVFNFSLGHEKQSRLVIPTIIMLIWVTICQLVFYFIQHNHGLDLSRALESQFRSDLFSSDFEYLLRSVGDLEKLATIRCPVVEQLEPHRRVLLDLSFRGDCIQNSWLLSGGQFSAKVRAINNDLFVVSFSTRNQIVFLCGLWAMRIGGLIFFSTIYLVQRMRNVQNDQLAKLSLEAAQKMTSLAAQVSHDIRSPLSALNLAVSTLQGWPDLLEEQRHLIRKATQRINDIANDLLNKSKVPDFGILAVGGPEELRGNKLRQEGRGRSHSSNPMETGEGHVIRPLGPVWIADLLDSVIREKRLQFCENSKLEIHLDLREGFGFFSVISAVELSRVISNLINNSVEASVNGGRITIVVRRYADQGQGSIVVSDQGRGISPEVLERIRAWAPSMSDQVLRIGGPQKGTGLGLHHARQTLARAGGEFSIQSQEGVGTIVTLLLPCAEEPRWFARRIDMPEGAVVVSVDDDPSIHQIWKMRLSAAELSRPHPSASRSSAVRHVILDSKASATEWILKHRDLNCVYLIDFEFLGEFGDGLDLIEEMGIATQSVLVTSRYEEPPIRSRSLDLGVRLLPKSLAAFVPLALFHKVQNDTKLEKALEKSLSFS